MKFLADAFLKQEKPEMDDFEEEKTLWVKENMMKNVFNGYPYKNATKYFCIFS